MWQELTIKDSVTRPASRRWRVFHCRVLPGHQFRASASFLPKPSSIANLPLVSHVGLIVLLRGVDAREPVQQRSQKAITGQNIGQRD